MNKEFIIGGVYLNSALVCAALAGVCLLVIRRLFSRVGAYAMVVNHGLFDACMFVLLWGLWTLVIAK